MPGYRETIETVERRVYPAARQTILDMPFDAAPQATFHEFWRDVVDGKLVSETPTGRDLRLSVGPTPTQIQLLDMNDQPVDGQFVTDHHIAYLLRCAYFHVARLADAEEVP